MHRTGKKNSEGRQKLKEFLFICKELEYNKTYTPYVETDNSTLFKVQGTT